MAITKYIAYRVSDGLILGQAYGYWADQAAADADANAGFGFVSEARAIPFTGEAPNSYDYYAPGGVITPIPENDIVLEIDGVDIDLAAMGIDPVHPPALPTEQRIPVQVRLGQHVKIKGIKEGTTYIRKGVKYVTTQPLTTVSWVVAKTGNTFEAWQLPYKGWRVNFEFVPS